jgi:erythromycin esterase
MSLMRYFMPNARSSNDNSPTPMPSPEEIEQLKQICHPLKKRGVNDNFNDLEFVNNVVGDATVVALGDLTHGIGNIVQMNHRIFEYLVKKMNFNIFALEDSMSAAHRLNDYVVHGKGNLLELLATSAGYRIWKTQEMFALIEWMRIYNQKTENKIQFFGFHPDHMSASEAIRQNINEPIINEIIEKTNRLFEDLFTYLHKDNDFSPDCMKKINLEIEKSAAYQELQQYIDDLNKYINTNESILKDKLGIREYEWLTHNVVILRQCSSCLVNNLLTARDAAMAENVLWIKNQTPNSKIVIMAHNGHIHKKGYDGNPVVWMGQHLVKELKDEYRCIGFIVYKGTYTIRRDTEGNIVSTSLETPPNNALESKIKLLNEPITFINLRNELSANILHNSVLVRIGLGVCEDKNSFATYDIRAGYDGIIYFETAIPSQPIKTPRSELNVFKRYVPQEQELQAQHKKLNPISKKLKNL